MVEQILQAAARVLATSGYAQMNTNRVAAEAGVSVGSLYRYFADKDEIFIELRDRASAEIMTELTDTVAASARLSPQVGVRAVVATLVDSLQRHEPVVRALVNEVPLGTQSNVLPEIERGLAQFTRIYVAQQASHLAAAELDARIYLAMGVTLNSCLRIALERPGHLDPEHLIDLVSGMLALGLTA